MSGDNSGFVGGNQDFSGGSGGGLTASQDFSIAGGVAGAAGSLLGGLATSSGDSAAASGYAQEAQLYNTAAAQAGIDVGLVQAGGNIQLAQLERQITSTEATGQAIEGAGNVATYGPTSANILAESQRQGQLAIGQQNLQTSVEMSNFQLMQTGYEAQSAGATGAEQAAQTAASAAAGGGILGALGGIAGVAGKIFGL